MRLRQRALVVRADNEGSSSAQVIYYRGGNFYRATAKAVILAGQGHTAHRVVVHLIGEEGPVHDAWCANAGGINLVPVVTANVTLEIYGETGIDWEQYYIPDVYSYYFDSHTPYADGTGWVHDVYGRGVRDIQYPARIIQDLQQAKQDLRSWYNTNGSPTDPADGTDPKYDYLAQCTSGWLKRSNVNFTSCAVTGTLSDQRTSVRR